MPKNENLIGKYSNQKNRDESVHLYDLAKELSPEICLDLEVIYTDDEFDEDLTTIDVLASNATLDSTFTFGAEIDSSNTIINFTFGDLFGNQGKGILDLSKNPIALKLEATEMEDESTLPYYKEYELYKQ